MEALTLNSILDFLYNIPKAVSPLFLGKGFLQVLFQGYAIFGLSGYSIYRIMQVRGQSVIVLSRTRLVMASLTIGTLYLAFHQILIYLIPANPKLGTKLIVLAVSFLVLTFIMYQLANLINFIINTAGGGPYVIEINRQKDNSDSLDIDSGFVRYVNFRYYAQGLYIPLMILVLFSEIPAIQLVLLISWFVWFVVLLLFRIHSFGGPIIYGYLILMFLASSYFVDKYSIFGK